MNKTNPLRKSFVPYTCRCIVEGEIHQLQQDAEQTNLYNQLLMSNGIVTAACQAEILKKPELK